MREHEKLDGLWADGLRNYPVSGDCPDIYADTLKQAQGQHDMEEVTGFLVEQIRRFRPQVVVTHDLNGEYGHGFHMLTAKAVTEAVEKAEEARQTFHKVQKSVAEETVKAVEKIVEDIQQDRKRKVTICLVAAGLVTLGVICAVCAGRIRKKRRK